MLTMTEHSDKHLSEIAYCYLGDARNNMGNSLMIGGCKLGMDVRLCAPEDLWPAEELVKTCREIAEETGARLTLTADVDEGVKASTSSTPTSGSRWARTERLGGTDRAPEAIPGQRRLIARTGNPHVKFMHCLPAFHNRETEVGEDIFQKFGLDGIEVTDEVFESRALDRLRPGREPDAHDQGHHGRHPRMADGDRMRVVVALGGNALLKRGEPMTAERQR